VSVEVALVAAFDGNLYTLVCRRKEHPERGRWALPGAFVRPDEPLDRTAARALREQTGLEGVFLEPLFTFGDPGRDPRGRVLSVAHYALVDEARFRTASARHPGVAEARLRVPWEGETGGPVEVRGPGGLLALAFDHPEIIGMAVKRLRGKLDYAPLGFQLLGDTFTLLALQKVHETVLGRPLNKDSFRRRMLASGLLDGTGRMEDGVDHRPAELYRFVRRSAA
jgi:8-oxo-dGTP diphosphatase